MNSADLQRYKKLLVEKQQELSFPELDAESPAPRAGGMEGDLGDIANAEAEAELRVRQNEMHLLRAIDEALAHMRKGTYGICETCKRPISKVRLEAVPWARYATAGSVALRRMTSSQPLSGQGVGKALWMGPSARKSTV